MAIHFGFKGCTWNSNAAKPMWEFPLLGQSSRVQHTDWFGGEQPRKWKSILLITRWHFGACQDFLWWPWVVLSDIRFLSSINLWVSHFQDTTKTNSMDRIKPRDFQQSFRVFGILYIEEKNPVWSSWEFMKELLINSQNWQWKQARVTALYLQVPTRAGCCTHFHRIATV